MLSTVIATPLSQEETSFLPAGLQWLAGPAEAAYGLAVGFRNWAYDSGLLPTVRLSVPVISIGNLTVGGTGKTPVVMALARFLEEQGYRVVVLSRGYKAAQKTDCHVADSPTYGDEPYLIQQHLHQGKVYVGANRVKTGTTAIQAEKPDVILMDDGFQHRRLHRDFNIVLVDGEVAFGNQRLLPAGPLREPVTSLKRADWVFITKSAAGQTKQVIEQCLTQAGLPPDGIPIEQCPFEPTVLKSFDRIPSPQPITTLQNRPVILLSGIANPRQFEHMICQTGDAQLIKHWQFDDHHLFTDHDLNPIWQQLSRIPDAWLIMTEKDRVKIETLSIPSACQPQLFSLQIQPQYDWPTLLKALPLPPKGPQ